MKVQRFTLNDDLEELFDASQEVCTENGRLTPVRIGELEGYGEFTLVVNGLQDEVILITHR